MALIAHYKLNGDLKDSVGNNHGVPDSSVNYKNGILGKTIDSDSSSAVNIPCGEWRTYSIAFWFKCDTPFTGNFRQFFRKGDNRSPSFWTRSNINRLHLQQELEGGNRGADTVDNFELKKWHHIVFICDAKEDRTSLSSYMDGKLQQTNTYHEQVSMSGNHFILHNIPDISMDDVRIYDHVLSLKEIQNLARCKALDIKFNDEFIYDSTSDTNIIYDNNNRPTLTQEQDKYYYKFEKGDVVLSDLDFPRTWDDKFTMTCWVYIGDSTPNDSTNRSNIFGRGSYGGSHGFYYFSQNNTVGVLLREDGSTTISVQRSVPRNTWTLLTGTWDGSQLRFYIDGVLQGTTNPTSLAGTPHSTNWYIGGRKAYGGDNGNHFVGGISEVMIFKSVLSDDDIKGLYQTKAAIDDKGNFHV